jgi:hypothetical protein
MIAAALDLGRLHDADRLNPPIRRIPDWRLF